MTELDKLVDVLFAGFPDARSFKVKIGAAGSQGAPFGNYVADDLMFRAGEHNLPLLDAKGYLAISQYCIDKDETTFLVARK